MSKTLAAVALSLITTGCVNGVPGMWQPIPIRGAPDSSEVIAASTAADWEDVPAENLMVIDLTGGGRVIILLAPEFAPVHVANIRTLASSGWWSSATIYRVAENYVTQWGNGEAQVPLPAGVAQQPPAEYHRPLAGLNVRALPYPDPYAAQVGHAAGWSVAFDRRSGIAWLPHCPGTVAVARGIAPDTGTGGELYAVTGPAPRFLDRNIAAVGRVIEGMSFLARRPPGSGPQGMYEREKGEIVAPIANIKIASDLPVGEQPRFQRMRTDSAVFGSYIRALANMGGPFFTQPAGGVDICRARVPVRRKAP